MESNQNIEITKDYKVLVGCLTYNHSRYIVDALNGFAMQQTDFPFACIVMDDASTDGEPEVIKDWLKRECDMVRAVWYDLELATVIIVPHQTNLNCTMAVYLLKRNLYNDGDTKFDLIKDWVIHCEYIALCEGDDYWTDSKKLQIQATCLDSHPEFDLCTHGYYEKNAISGDIIDKKLYSFHNTTIPLKTIILEEGDFLATNSLFYRKILELSLPDFRKFLYLDYTLCLQGASRCDIYYLHQNMSVYRRFVPNSVTTLGEHKEEHFFRLAQMFDILDKEKDYQYHTYIETRKLLISFLNSQPQHYGIFGFLKKNQTYNIKCKLIFLIFIFSHYSWFASIHKKAINCIDTIINSIL